MTVSSVNSVAFTGKVATTKQGNEYKKTSAGKITMVAIDTACIGAYAYGVHKTIGFKKLLVPIAQMLRHGVQRLAEPAKAMKAAKLATIGSAAIVLVSSLGVGAIIDGVVNHARAKKADKAAKAE